MKKIASKIEPNHPKQQNKQNCSYLQTPHVGKPLLICNASLTSCLLNHAVVAVALMQGRYDAPTPPDANVCRSSKSNKKTKTNYTFLYAEENNTGLPPVPFHHHSPLHTLKVTDISVKLNRMQCKQSDFVS